MKLLPMASATSRLRAILVASVLTSVQPLLAAPPADTVADRVLVRFKPAISEQAGKTLAAVHAAEVIDEVAGIGVKVLRVRPGNTAAVLEALTHNPNVEFAEPDYVGGVHALTNDPYVQNGTEWHLSKVAAVDAWNVSSGANVTIAVVDSGVAAGHPDLAGKVLAGYNFYDGNTDTSDVYGHGTAVAGTAASQGNNAIGTAGVAYSALILPVRVTDTTGYTSYSNLSKAITYAADHGARVINISIGGSSSSSSLQSAVDYATSRNVIVVASAGNNGTNTPQYPAACRGVMGVSATDSADAITSWSSYGSYVSLSAPGAGIATTNRDGTYGSWSGTSFSSPVVAGVAAVLLGANPSASATQVIDALKAGSDDLGTAGYDVYYGAGRVNASRALQALGMAPADTTAPAVSFSSPAAGSTVSGAATITVNATDAVGVSRIDLAIDGANVASATQSPASFAWDTTGAANGTHQLKAVAYDAAGNAGVTQVSINVQNTVPDSVAPSAQITSPTEGASIGKTLKVYTVAQDNVGVSRVELYADRALVGTSTAANAVFSLNTLKWKSGSHVLQTIGYDAAGNAGSSALVTVTK